MVNKLLIGNLKANLLAPAERSRYVSGLKAEISKAGIGGSSLVICPPILHLEAFVSGLEGAASVGIQDGFWEEKGSYTGEVSMRMARNFGAEYAIVGHSERRRLFGENGRIINAKVLAAAKSGLKAIVCVGETKQEKEGNQILRVLTAQLREALDGVLKSRMSGLVIAYEPVWAVGTDKVPSANEIMEAKVIIRKILFSLFDRATAEKVPVLYGGSVTSFNAKQVCLDSAMDGALVGRESLIPKEFVRIAEILGD